MNWRGILVWLGPLWTEDKTRVHWLFSLLFLSPSLLRLSRNLWHLSGLFVYPNPAGCIIVKFKQAHVERLQPFSKRSSSMRIDFCRGSPKGASSSTGHRNSSSEITKLQLYTRCTIPRQTWSSPKKKISAHHFPLQSVRPCFPMFPRQLCCEWDVSGWPKETSSRWYLSCSIAAHLCAFLRFNAAPKELSVLQESNVGINYNLLNLGQI